MASSTATHITPMRTVLLSYNPGDERAVQLLTSIKLLDIFRVEESPYDPTFVDKIRRAEKSKKHSVDISKIWD